jgi:uncharacterized protein (DUF2062 family)
VLAALIGAPSSSDRLDPSWPPVLIAFVVAAVSAVAISIVVVLKRLRADARQPGGSR